VLHQGWEGVLDDSVVPCLAIRLVVVHSAL